MRHRLRHCFFAAGLSLIMCILSPFAYAGEVWKVASLDWEPYSSSDMNNQGNVIQKLRNLLAERDIELVVEFYPWSRARQIAKDESYVGYFPAWVEEVDEGFIASPPIEDSWIAVLKKPGRELRYRGVEELFMKYSVGLVSSYNYPTQIEKASELFKKNTVLANSETSLLNLLNSGRFVCAITDPYVMTYLAQKRGDNEVEIDRILLRKDLVIALRKDSQVQARYRLLESLLND